MKADRLFEYFIEGITLVVTLYEICRMEKRVKRKKTYPTNPH